MSTPHSKTCAIVNPHSSNERTGAAWPALKAKLSAAIGPVETRFTEAPMDAVRLTRQALRDGADLIVSVGGDGSVNEVVNGFFEDGAPVNENASLALLTSGTGGDFRRTFGLPKTTEEQIARIANGAPRRIDLGRIHFIDHNGNETLRYFDNIASFGLSGVTSHTVNQLSYGKLLGGKLAFKWGTIKAAVKYTNQPVRMQIDDSFDEVVQVNVVSVCNGQYFGAGMHVAPDAVPDDGLFDIVFVTDVGSVRLILRSGAVYKGKHLDFDEVMVHRGRRVVATPAEGAGDVLLDIDGEGPGRLPATFDIIPGALNLWL